MKCPVDDTALTMAELKSMVVDFCPKCRGVWLSRDSLNKLLTGPAEKPPESPKPEEEKQKTIVDDFLEGFGLK
jgi:uncharacterized protein